MNQHPPSRLPGLAAHHIDLLRAALCEGHEAIPAWHAWRARVSLERADEGSTRIFPLVYRNLRAQGVAEGELPPLLKGTCRHTWARTQPLLDAGTRAARILEDRGMEVFFIKGAAAILSYYPHADVRAIHDVDLLVPFGAARDALSALRSAGWQPLVPDAERLIAVRHAAAFTDSKGRRLNLHWHALLERCDEASDVALLREARAARHNDTTVRLPGAASLLVMACVYGPHTPAHPPLRWIADVVTIARQGVDWQRVVDLTRQLQLAAPVRPALEFLSSRVGLSVPGDTLRQLRELRVSSADRLAHAVTSRSQLLLGCLPALWFNYRRARAAAPRVSFPRYVQYHFGLPGLGSLPGFVAKAGARRLARCAS